MPFARFRLMYVLPALLPLLLVAGSARAQGTAGAYSLQIPPGARAEGMGRSFTAIADDAFAPWWNPGGLAFLDGKHAALMHTKLVPDLADDVYFEYLSYAQHLSGWGGIAATITYLSYGESQATDPGQGDLGTFSSWEIAPSIAIGTSITDNLGLGANLKYVHLDLAPALSSTSGQAGKGEHLRRRPGRSLPDSRRTDQPGGGDSESGPGHCPRGRGAGGSTPPHASHWRGVAGGQPGCPQPHRGVRCRQAPPG